MSRRQAIAHYLAETNGIRPRKAPPEKLTTAIGQVLGWALVGAIMTMFSIAAKNLF
ncbi:hypothetical protein N9204_00310 [bacterium]|nr:hypothetical protein [bacterium]